MSTEPAAVDVVIPVRNGEATILRAIESVLAQTLTDFRLYVVDDGSTDRTAEVVAGIDDERVVLERTEHRGVSAARNTGAALGSAPRIAFLDADDEVLPTWLESLTGPNAPLVRCSSYRCEPGKQPTVVDATTGPLLAGTFVVVKWLFDEIGGYDERLAYSENTDLRIRLDAALENRQGLIGYVETPLMKRRADRQLRKEKYGNAALRDAAELLLEKHSDTLTREARASFSGVAGVNSLLLGDRARARSHLRTAIRCAPTRWRYGLRFIQALAPASSYGQRRRAPSRRRSSRDQSSGTPDGEPLDGS